MDEDEEAPLRAFTVLYGSQTGNSQDVAERIARQGRRRHVDVRVCSMEAYDIGQLINEALVVLVVGTTGNGDFPTSAVPFWRFLLRSDLPGDILSDLTVATFGLGDSSYRRFCWPIRKINKRLQALGAVQLVGAGEADDQHYLGIEGTLRPWLEGFWTAFEEVMPEAAEKAIPDEVRLPPEIAVRLLEKQEGRKEPAPLERGWRWATVRRNERLTEETHWQDVRMLAFDTDEACEYRATDVLSLVPENGAEEVDRLLERLGWQGDVDLAIELVPFKAGQGIPARLQRERHLTLQRLLTAHVDFKAVPRPSFFERILPFAPADHMQREKLQEFTTPGEGADEMYEYAIRVRRTMLEVLEEFDTVRIPVEYVLDVFPLLRRREFSIASAPSQSHVELAVAIVDYKTRLKDRRKGVCTSWLADLKVGARVPVMITPSAMPTEVLGDFTLPAVFVGPGTGVAPIRSAVWTRHQHATASSPMLARDNLCFFGCRYRAKDFLFAQEWDTLQSQGCLDIHLAASRDQEEKVYVQDLIAQQSERVWDIIGARRGMVYVCGSAGKMPQAVRAAVVEICRTHLLDDDGRQAESLVEEMEREGRWIEECWE